MKFHTTQKAIRNNYFNVIRIGYCDLQHLLTYKRPIAYTTRTEGWGCDIYEYNCNTVIATGYAPFGNIKPSYELTRKYDDKARELINKAGYNPDVEKCLNELLDEYIKEAVKE